MTEHKSVEDRIEDAASDMGFDTTEDLINMVAERNLVLIDPAVLDAKDK